MVISSIELDRLGYSILIYHVLFHDFSFVESSSAELH